MSSFFSVLEENKQSIILLYATERCSPGWDFSTHSLRRLVISSFSLGTFLGSKDVFTSLDESFNLLSSSPDALFFSTASVGYFSN